MPRQRHTVYSTDDNEMERIREQARQMRKGQKTVSLPIDQQVAHLHREKKGRGGKAVTVIRNLQLSQTDSKALCKKLKQQCGCGGSVKEGQIEIQGDRRPQVAEILQKLGYKTKNVGG